MYKILATHSKRKTHKANNNKMEQGRREDGEGERGKKRLHTKTICAIAQWCGNSIEEIWIGWQAAFASKASTAMSMSHEARNIVHNARWLFHWLVGFCTGISP